MDNKARTKVNSGLIVGLILSVVFFTVLLSVASNVIPTGAMAYHSLATAFGGNSTIYGSGASSFATNTIAYVGWFWVLAPFILTVGLIMALFVVGGRRR